MRSAREIAAGYLAPERSAQRRLLLQIHQASERDADLRAVLAAWHRRSSEQLRPLVREVPGGDDAVTVLKAFYLLLLGLCHLEHLDALDAPADRVTARVGEAVDALFAGTVG